MLHLVVSECHFYSSSHITATAVPQKSDLHHILSPRKKRTLSANALLQTEVLCFFYVAEAHRSRRLYSIFCVESLSHKIAIPSNCSLRGEPVVCPTITQAAARLKLFHFISRIDFAAISSLSYGNFLHCTICASACFDSFLGVSMGSHQESWPYHLNPQISALASRFSENRFWWFTKH